MFLRDKAPNVLEKLGIKEEEILYWQSIFDLAIQKDKQGNNLYNDNLIKTFKNIKKDLALGYNYEEIGKKLGIEKNYPALQEKPSNKVTINPIRKPINQNKNFETVSSNDNLHLIKLIERLMDEKNQMIFEKDYLLGEIHGLKLKIQELQTESDEYADQISKYMNQIEVLEDQLSTYIPEIGSDKFIGNWLARAKLIKIVFNTVDIDIPKERNKSFKVIDNPKRIYGNLAVLTSKFKCDEDPLWERYETYRIAYMNPEELKGELDVEYYVDNVPIAKAIYEIICQKKPVNRDITCLQVV